MNSPALNILAIDTALIGCCVAASGNGGKDVVSVVEEMARGQAAKLVPLIQETLKKGGIAFEELDLIGTTIGPGSFTGVRVGMSTARALGLSLGKPVIGVTTLDVLARQVLNVETLAEGEILAVLIETKRTDYYLGLYSADGQEIEPPQALAPDTLIDTLKDHKVVFAGDAVKRLRQELDKGDVHPEEWRFIDAHDLLDPVILTKCVTDAYLKHHENGGVFPKPAPLYLRPADVSKPKRAPRKIVYR